MKKNILFITAAFLLLFGLWTCADIDHLSDVNSLSNFKISMHSPQEIVIGEVEITADNIIAIPIKYGVDKFPLTFSAEVSFTGKIDCVVGIDFAKELTLTSLDESLMFTVVAESGLPRKYTVVARPVDYVLPSEIPFKLLFKSSENTAVLESAFVAEDTLTIYVIHPEFPISIVPKFEISETFEFKNFVNGQTAFTFQTLESLNKLTIEDKINGSTKDMIVRLYKLKEVLGKDDDYTNTNLYNTEFKATMQGKEGILEYKGHSINNAMDSVLLYTHSLGAASGFPVDFLLELGSLKDNIRLQDFTEQVTFNDYNEYTYFYMIDLTKKISRKWTVMLVEFDVPELPTAADVTDFTFDYTAYITESNKNCITLDKSNVEIYSENGEIWLKMTEHSNTLEENNWRVILNNVVITTSPGATFTMPQFKWNGSNDAWTGVVSFDVRSPKGMVKTWKVGIKDARDYIESAECDIISATVSSILPINAGVLSTQAEINAANKTISIYLSEDEGAYPITIQLAYTISQYANIVSQDNNTQPLVFASQSSSVTIAVRAENLINTQNYTVKLVAPPKSSEANITAFNVGALSPASFAVSGVSINTSAQEIVLSLSSSGSCPLTVNYTMDISRKASTDKALAGSFIFNNLAQQQTITVTAEDGTTKQWKIRFADYTPQLINWDMETWSGRDPQPKGTQSKPYWATANTTIVIIQMTGTTYTTGPTGLTAKLSSLKAPVLGTFASASLFLGWFDASKITSSVATSDPVVLTWQGIPFSATKKIIGVEVDVNYSSAGAANDDSGAITVELVKNNSASTYEYHGRRPTGEVHPNNTAVAVVSKKILLGHKAATVNGVTVDVVEKGVWLKKRIEFNYTGIPDVFDYTHFNIICASSSQGDSFIGEVGSTLLIDNIKLIYEGDE